jgi:MATE family multidrug resistance protein
MVVVNKTFLFEIIRVGLPLGCVFCVEVALFAVVAFMMGALGTTTLAAYQISYQYLMLGLSLIFALTQCAAVRVGHEVGRNNKDALKLAAYVNIGIAFCIMLLFSVTYIGFPISIISLDINIHSVVFAPIAHEATIYLAIVGVLLLIDSVRLISFGALRGMKDTKFPMVASIIGFWCIAFPAAYFFGFKFHFGGTGIWCGVVIGLFVAGVILFVRFNRLINRIDLSTMVTR